MAKDEQRVTRYIKLGRIEDMSKATSVAAAMLLLLTVGCGANSASEPEADSASEPYQNVPIPEGEITLDFPSWQANEPGAKEVWEAIISEYERQFPNVTVNFQYVANADYSDMLVRRLSTDTPPDILVAGGPHWPALLGQDWLEPLTDLLAETGVAIQDAKFQEGRIVDGEQLGLVLHGLTRGLLYYNEEILTAAGVEVPTTPAEVLAASEAIGPVTDDETFSWGTITMTHPGVLNQATDIVAAAGVHWYVDDQSQLTDPTLVEAVDVYRQLAAHAPPGVDSARMRQLFADGRIAMLTDGNWGRASYQEGPEEVVPHLKVAASPFGHGIAYGGASLSIAKALSPERKRLALEFIRIAAQPELQQLWLEHYDSPPALIADPVKDDLDDAQAAILRNIEDSVPLDPPNSPSIQENYGRYRDALIEALIKLQQTDEPTLEVLQAAERELSDILGP